MGGIRNLTISQDSTASSFHADRSERKLNVLRDNTHQELWNDGLGSEQNWSVGHTPTCCAQYNRLSLGLGLS